jgi:hypothetical protein
MSPEHEALVGFCSVPGALNPGRLAGKSGELAIPEHDRVNLASAEFEVALRCVIRTKAQLDELWVFASREESTPPAVSGDSILVLAMGGMRPSGGHSFGFGKVIMTGDTAIAEVLDYLPGNGCIETAEVMVPAAAVRIPAVPVVRFHEYMTTGEHCLDS